MSKKLYTNSIAHVHFRKRGKKWAYSFEKARIEICTEYINRKRSNGSISFSDFLYPA